MNDYAPSGLVSAGSIELEDTPYPEHTIFGPSGLISAGSLTLHAVGDGIVFTPSGLVSAGTATLVDPVRVQFWHRRAGEKRPFILKYKPADTETDPSTSEGRRALVTGEFFPDSTTTGVYDADALVNMPGNQSFGIPGEVIENIRFLGTVSVTTNGVYFRNCEFLGPSPTPESGPIVRCWNNDNYNILFEDCTFRVRSPGERADCIMARGTTLLRCDLSGGVDQIGAAPYTSGPRNGRCDVQVLGCWLHDGAVFSPCSYQSDNITHSDMIQWHGGAGLVVRGSRIDGWIDESIGNALAPGAGGRPASEWQPGQQRGASGLTGRRRSHATLMISPGDGTHSELVVERCWMDGSVVGVNSGGSASSLLASGVNRIVDNHIGLDWYHTEQAGAFTVPNSFGLLLKSAHQVEVAGNTLWNSTDPWDTSTPNNTRKNG